MKSTILIVSNDKETLSIAQRILSEDYELLVAKTGTEGITLLETHLPKIQMIVLDTALTDMLAQDWIKTASKHHLAYTILIASDETPDWMVESMKAGAMDIVRKKPLYDGELGLAVKQGFDYAKVNCYLSRMAELNKNQTIQQRFNSFLELLKARKAKGESITPSEISLYFPSEEFKAELPLDQVISAIETGEACALLKKWKHRPKLLVVDDESPIRKLLFKEFSREFEVILACSCEEATQFIEDQSDIDIAILDIGMPGMSGDDFVSILKQKIPNIQVVMLTGYPEYRLISKTINHGAGDYFIKPYDSDHLRQRVFGLLQSSLLNRVLSKYMQAEG